MTETNQPAIREKQTEDTYDFLERLSEAGLKWGSGAGKKTRDHPQGGHLCGFYNSHGLHFILFKQF